MFYYVILLCIILFIAIYLLSKSTKEEFNLGLTEKETYGMSKMIQINNPFFGNLVLFKERNKTLYAYNKQDKNIYKCIEEDTFSKTQTNWEPIVEISSLNDYDILDNEGKVIVTVSNDGMQFFRTDKKEFSDIFTDVIDTTYNNTFHISKIINAKDVNGEGASSCSELANIVNNKKNSDELVSDSDTVEKVEYNELNAEQCKEYAQDKRIPYKTINNANYWPKGCLIRISDKDVFYNTTNNARGNYRNNNDKKNTVNVCQAIDTTQKLGEQMESPTNPKIFTISKMTFSLCCVGNGFILICDQVNKQLVSLKVTDLTRGVKVEYSSDIIRSTSELYIFRDDGDVYVLEGKLNHIYMYNFDDSQNHTTIIDYKYWLDMGSKYGLTREILEETKVYGLWMKGDIFIVYGLFPRLFETENNRITLFQFRVNTSNSNVKLEDMIRLPSTVFGSSLKTIYETLGASNLYYKQRNPSSNSDFILATNKSSNFITFYGIESEYNKDTIVPSDPSTPPSDSNALDDLSDYLQYSPAMNGIDKYLMNSENKDGSKEFREGDYIYFVMKKPIMFKGIAIKTLNDVRIRAFELYILRDGKTFSISNQGNTIQDNEDNYRRIINSENKSVYGKPTIDKPDEVQIYHIRDGINNKPVYTTVVKLKILKLNKINQEKEIGDFKTKFQGLLYGLKLETLEDVEEEYKARNASCESELKDVETKEVERRNKEEEINKIDKAIQEMLKNKETTLASDMCNEYFDKASKYIGDENISIENKRNIIELYKTSIESCKTMIKNKKEYSENKLSDNMKSLFRKQTSALENIKKIEDAIENLNMDGSYFKGYKYGNEILNTYSSNQARYLNDKYDVIDPNNSDSSTKQELNQIENDITALKTQNKQEGKCGNTRYNSVVQQINNYLKFSRMYNVLTKLIKDKVYGYELDNLLE